MVIIKEKIVTTLETEEGELIVKVRKIDEGKNNRQIEPTIKYKLIVDDNKKVKLKEK